MAAFVYGKKSGGTILGGNLPNGKQIKEKFQKSFAPVREFLHAIGEHVRPMVEPVTKYLAPLGRKIEGKMPPMNGRHWIVASAAVVGVFAVIVLSYAILSGDANKRNLDPDQIIYLSVKDGMSASEINDELVERGILDNKFAFWWQVKVSGKAGDFKAGMYAMHPRMDASEVLQQLVDGKTAVVKFTIPEGFDVKQIAERLSSQGLVNKQAFLDAAKKYQPYDYVTPDKNVRYACEGFLFPDTYELHQEPTPEDILKMMSEDFDNRLTPAMRQRAKEEGLSVYSLITLASLVEKEAMYPEDRPIIAQVFFKRLQLGMPLQSDATLQYLMDTPKENVTIKDTKIQSPYNSYQNAGLPPGPIANPGMASIQAVLYPADTDYLYFVADHDGHNHYSSTYDEHQALVAQYR